MASTTTYTKNTTGAAGGPQTTVYTPNTSTNGMPVPSGTDVASLNAARDAAANAGQNVYAGNLSSLSAFNTAPVAPAATPATPISAAAVNNPQTPVTIPGATSSTANTAGATIAGTAASTANAANVNDPLIAQEGANVATDQANVNTSKNVVQQYIDKLLGKGQVEQQMETDAGIPGLQTALTDANNDYNTKAEQFAHAQTAIYNTPGYTKEQADAESSALSRQNNAELADIAIRQSVASGNLTNAQNIINNKIDLQYGDLKDIIGYQMSFLQQNQSTLSNDQQNELNAQITKNQEQYTTATDAAKALETQKLSMLQNAMELGAPASVQTAIQNAATPEDAIAAAGQYAGGLDAEQKRASIAASNASTKKSNYELQQEQGGAGYNGDFAATISLAANTGGTNAQRQQIQQNLQQFIAAKDYPSAYAQILQTTGNGLTGTAKTDFNNRNSQLGVTADLQTAIKQLNDSGYDTNKLTGTADQIGTKLGILAEDPKYAATANQLDLAFQNYRQAMTGAAFGAKESTEYASVLPSKSNTFKLNEAKITGLNNYLTSVVDSYTGQVVGPGGKEIRQYAQGATPAAPAATGPSVTVGGQSYAVGSILQNALGQKAKVNADGTVTPL